MAECTHDCSTCGENCAERTTPVDPRAPANPNSNVKKVIAVMSGKGGVGKSLVTACLAAAVQRGGKQSESSRVSRQALALSPLSVFDKSLQRAQLFLQVAHMQHFVLEPACRTNSSKRKLFKVFINRFRQIYASCT